LLRASSAALARVYPDADITGVDASEGMLAQARLKTKLDGVDFRHGDAMDVRACGINGQFDGILMAYGIRNVPDADLCLQRLIGLLNPGGRIVFHEYSVDDSLWGKAVWNLVCLGVIIPGGLLTNPRSGIYRYLRRSVNEFDGVRAFRERLVANGFVNVDHKSMGGWQWGIVHSFIAERPR
jgi:ubiquinone/menaquinone biosynthesis C-methylase UbiE